MDIPASTASEFADRIAFSSEGNLVAVRGQRALRVWDVSSGEVLVDRWVGDAHRGPLMFTDNDQKLIHSSTCYPSGNVVAANANIRGGDTQIQFLDVKSHVETSVSPESGGVCIAISLDGKLAASTNGSRLFLWHTETGQTVQELGVEIGPTQFSAVTFSENGSLFAAADIDGGVHVWEALTGWKIRELEEEKVRNLGPQRVRIKDLALSPDGEYLAWITGSSVRLWNISDGSELWSATRDPALSITFSYDGRLLAMQTSPKWHIWEVTSGKQVSAESIQIKGIVGDPRSSALSLDFRTVAWGERLVSLYLRDVIISERGILNARRETRVLTHRPEPPRLAYLLQFVMIVSLPVLAIVSLVLPIVGIVAVVKASRRPLPPQGRPKWSGALATVVGTVGVGLWLAIWSQSVGLTILVLLGLAFGGRF